MKKIIVGNWKMNPLSQKEASEILSSLKRFTKNFKKTEVVICLPFVYLPSASKNQKSSPIKIGSQNVHWEEKGAFTGEVSPIMLKDLGVSHVILGHSERRIAGETDETINNKLIAVLKNKMTPILCIGESERDEDGKFFEFLKTQLKIAFSKIKKSDLSNIIIAYEPVWAIGKSEDEYMKGEELHQMTIFIRKVLSEIYNKKDAWEPRIIYGGSVTSFNVEDIVFQGQVDGILPGRASLNPIEMKKILQIMESGKNK